MSVDKELRSAVRQFLCAMGSPSNPGWSDSDILEELEIVKRRYDSLYNRCDSLYNKLLDGCEEQAALESGMKILKEKLVKAKETLKIYSRCKTEGDDGLFLSCGDVARQTLKEIE